MTRWVYSTIFYLALPLILLRLLWRSIKAPHYRNRWKERFGFAPWILSETALKTTPNKSVLWLHTVSVGEAIAAKPLVEALLSHYPDDLLVITTTTPTGSAQVKKQYAQQLTDGKIFHTYIPYDLPDCIDRFLNRAQPKIAIFMETEVWPNILHSCHHKNIATVLVNARLSDKSLKSYQKLSNFSQQTFSMFTKIIAQTEQDASRFTQLLPTLKFRTDYQEDSQKVNQENSLNSKDKIIVSGNIKTEIVIDPSLRVRAKELKDYWSQQGSKKIIIAASTHRGEDEIILSTYQQLLKKNDGIRLLIVPRHPERFVEVRQQCEALGLIVASRSESAAISDDVQVIVGDTMGEMMLFFGVSDIAIIGGSFIEHGGHNMLEAAAWGLPIISGKSVYNFSKIATDMEQQQALLLLDADKLVESIQTFLQDASGAQSFGQKALHYVESNKGALEKTMVGLQSLY